MVKARTSVANQDGKYDFVITKREYEDWINTRKTRKPQIQGVLFVLRDGNTQSLARAPFAFFLPMDYLFRPYQRSKRRLTRELFKKSAKNNQISLHLKAENGKWMIQTPHSQAYDFVLDAGCVYKVTEINRQEDWRKRKRTI